MSMQGRFPLKRLRIVLPVALALAFTVPVVSAGDETGKASLPTNLRYTSPLAAYRKFAEQPVGSWRDANDNVGRVGGWRAYAREAQDPTPAEGSTKAVDPHAGHHPEPSK
jgi:hypothetical protein